MTLNEKNTNDYNYSKNVCKNNKEARFVKLKRNYNKDVTSQIFDWYCSKNKNSEKLQSLSEYIEYVNVECFSYYSDSNGFKLSDTVIMGNAKNKIESWYNNSRLSVIFYFLSSNEINIIGVFLPMEYFRDSLIDKTKICTCNSIHILNLLLHRRTFYRKKEQIAQFLPKGRVTSKNKNICFLQFLDGDQCDIKIDKDHSWFIFFMLKLCSLSDNHSKVLSSSGEKNKSKSLLYSEISEFFQTYKPKKSDFFSSCSVPNSNITELFKKIKIQAENELNLSFSSSSSSSSSSLNNNITINNNSDDDSDYYKNGYEKVMCLARIEIDRQEHENINSFYDENFEVLYREAVNNLSFFSSNDSDLSKRISLYHGCEWVIQRMCARDPLLNSIVTKGLRIWYWYCFEYKFSLDCDLERLFSKYKENNFFSSLEIHSICDNQYDRKLFKSYDITWVRESFKKRFPNKPIPTKLFSVPWKYALNIISRRSCLMKQGVSYFTYVEICDWLICRWNQSVENFKKYDEEMIFQFWGKLRKSHILGENYFAEPMRLRSEYLKTNNTINNNNNNNVDISMFTMSYLSDGRFNSTDEATERIFGDTVNNWNQKRLLLVNRINRKNTQLNSKRVQLANKIIQDSENKNLSFVNTWCHVFPPCISKTIKDQFKNKTHFIDKQRIFIFQFLYHIGVPLEDTQKMWFDMCFNDSSTNTRRKYNNYREFSEKCKVFGHYPAYQYKYRRIKEQNNNSTGNIGYYSCKSVSSFFPGNCQYDNLRITKKHNNNNNNNNSCCSSSSSSSSSSSKNGITDIEDLFLEKKKSRCFEDSKNIVLKGDSQRKSLFTTRNLNLSKQFWSPAVGARRMMQLDNYLNIAIKNKRKISDTSTHSCSKKIKK